MNPHDTPISVTSHPRTAVQSCAATARSARRPCSCGKSSLHSSWRWARWAPRLRLATPVGHREGSSSILSAITYQLERVRSDSGGAYGRAEVQYRDLLGMTKRVRGRALWVQTPGGGPSNSPIHSNHLRVAGSVPTAPTTSLSNGLQGCPGASTQDT